MTYENLILQLRNQVGDTRRRVHVDFIGDGATTIFQMPADTFPVLDQAGTYIVKVAGTGKTEASDYTLDKEAGTLTLNSAPTLGQAITLDNSAVRITDAGWISIINSVIYSLGDDFWKEFVDETNFTSTAQMLLLSLVASQPNCIAIYEFQTRENNGVNWKSVEEGCNWRYDRDNNIIYIGSVNAFTESGKAIRLRGLKKYTMGSAIGDTLDVQDKFLTILEYGCLARYWRWRYKDVVELVSKMTQENTRTPLQELIMLSDRFDRLYEIEKGKLKPAKPARIIPRYLEGGGRP
jgi:hypothetical protein